MNYDRTRWIPCTGAALRSCSRSREEEHTDLEHAIELYQDILTRHADEREVAASAAEYLGRSYQDLG